MKKLVWVWVAAAAVMFSCQSKGNKAEIVAESATDSLYMVNDSTLGETQTCVYEGILPAADTEGIKYLLTIWSQENNGDGTYSLTTTYIGADKGKDQSFHSKGKSLTKRGMPSDKNATVYQLVPEDGSETIYFLAQGDSTLTLLTSEMELPESGLNYTIKKVK